jgi:isopentenyldiphosphate isomerase/tetratricopeptide (TPR) repeat protein
MSGRLVGRERETDLLREVLDATPRPRVVSLSGVAGIGKSTLLGVLIEEARQRTRPFTSFSLQSWRSSPIYDHFHPVIGMFYELLSERSQRSSRFEWDHTCQLVDRYRRAHAQLVSQFKGDESKVSALLRVGVAAVRAGATLVPQVKPIADAVSDELLSAVIDYMHRRLRDDDRELLEHTGPRVARTVLNDFGRTCRSAGSGPVLVALDDYEVTTRELDSWLRKLAGGGFGPLDDRVVFVFAGRLPLSADWVARGRGDTSVLNLPLGLLSVDDLEELLRPILAEANTADPPRVVAEYLGECGRVPVLARLLLNDPRKLIQDLSSRRHMRPAAHFEWGVALEDFVERFFGGNRMTDDERRVVVALSVPRILNDDVVGLTLQVLGADPGTSYGEWLTRGDLIDRLAPAYTLHAAVREVFLENLNSRRPDTLRRLHAALCEYYALRASQLPVGEGRCLAQVEAAYHQLSATDAESASILLSRILEGLPETYLFLLHWGIALDQILREQAGLSNRARVDLERIGTLIRRAWELTNRSTDESGAFEAIDPIVDVFSADLLREETVQVNTGDYESWLRYFELRIALLTGELPPERLIFELEHLFQLCAGDLPEHQSLLPFAVATDLAEVFNLHGRIGESLKWTRRALRLANGRRSYTKAVALINHAANLKRVDEFRLAIDSLNQAYRLLTLSRPLPRYRLGALLLDAANCHSYLGDFESAAGALEIAKENLKGVSPHLLGEAFHRLGWKERLEGRLDDSLRDHTRALAQFGELEHRGQAVRSVVLRTLRAKTEHSLGNTLTEMHRDIEALRRYGAAESAFADLGLDRHVAMVRKDKALAQSRIDGKSVAVADLTAALDQLRKHAPASTTHVVEGLLTLARLSFLSRDLDRAAAAAEEAHRELATLEQTSPVLKARVLLERALVVALRDRNYVADALAMLDTEPSLGSRADLWAYARLGRALAEYAMGRQDEAERLFSLAREEASRWNVFLPYDLDEVWNGRESAHSYLGTTLDLLDTYNSQGELQGSAPAALVHDQGRWHRSFHCWITGRDVSGQITILFQRRGPASRKKDFPDFIDISAAGHYRAGEGVEGGVRELKEELGIEVAASDLQLIARRQVSEKLEGGRRNNEFQEIYLLDYASHPITRLRPSYPEVTAVVACRLDLAIAVLRGERHSVVGESLLFEASTGNLNRTMTTVSGDSFIPSAVDYLIAVLELIRRIRSNMSSAIEPVAVYLDDGSKWIPLQG